LWEKREISVLRKKKGKSSSANTREGPNGGNITTNSYKGTGEEENCLIWDKEEGGGTEASRKKSSLRLGKKVEKGLRQSPKRRQQKKNGGGKGVRGLLSELG